MADTWPVGKPLLPMPNGTANLGTSGLVDTKTVVPADATNVDTSTILPEDIKTGESDEDGENETVTTDNGTAELNVDATAPPAEDEYFVGTILPVKRNLRTNERSLAVPGFVRGMWDAFTLPGDVMQGKVDPHSDEGMERTLGLAGMMVGNPAVPRPKGSVGSGGIRYGRRRGRRKPNTEVSPTPITAGEPVSVATGEYLETWRDFVVPGTLPFDGARYMGLKLGLPDGYVSPLGTCQLSMFDEVVSNPSAGQLLFHQADGKRVAFDRPFNFLPSTNTSYPHLELKAPWLKRLTLKDRRIVKHFRQYADGVYRLERIEDLNGHAIAFTRGEAGVLEHVDGPDGLSLRFENDADGRRTSTTLVESGGAELPLATYAYDARGRMVSADCAYGMSVRYGWLFDTELLDWWRDASGVSETHFLYDDRGRVVHTKTSGIWNDDRFQYEGGGEGRAGATDYLPGGAKAARQRFVYDANGSVTSEINALGHATDHAFNAYGRRIATTDPLGHADSAQYDVWGNVRRHADAEGRETIYGWGPDGELHIVIDGAGNRREYKHDERSNVIREIDAEGFATELTRDESGRVIATRYPDGTVTRQEWDERNRLVVVTDPKGGVTRHGYDAFNRLVATTDPLGHTTRYGCGAGTGGFDTANAIERPDGVVVRRTHDEQSQLASVTDGEGRTWRYRHGAFGVLEAITDPGGGTLRLGYDIEGRLTSVTNANGATYAYERDVAGRLVAEDDFDGRRTLYEHDAAGRVTAKTKPDGARLLYAYDKTNRLRRIDAIAPDGTAEAPTRLWYDGRGLLKQAENGAALVEFDRDKVGRIVGETINGKRVRSQLDAMGRRIEREIVASVEGETGGLTRYHRDPLGHIARSEIAARDGTDASSNGRDPTVIEFERDAMGREVARSCGAFRLDQRFDAAGQLMHQHAPLAAGGARRTALGTRRGHAPSPSQQVIARLYEYDRAFAPTRIDDKGWGETRYEYDNNGQVTRTERRGLGERSGPASIPNAGDMLGVSDALNSTGETFAYDAARNLVGASPLGPRAGYGGASYRARTTENWRSSPGGVVTIARAPTGERVAMEHDACGRVIRRRVERDGFRPRSWRYEWDAHDRLVTVHESLSDGGTQTWRYGYDAFGRRVHKLRVRTTDKRGWGPDERGTPDAEIGTAFLWDGDALVAEAPMLLDGTVRWDRGVHWTYGDNSHVPLARIAPPPIEADWQRALREQDRTLLPRALVHHCVPDQLGAVRELIAVQLCYGTATASLAWAERYTTWGALDGPAALKPQPQARPADLTDLNPWRLPGQYADPESGLSYNRHRHYDPLIGHYASPDPIGLAGGDRPQGYVERPTAWTDPLGLAAAVRTQDIRYTQDSISYRFQDTSKGNVDDLIRALKDGSVTADDLPPIRIVREGDQIFTLDNRRLFAAKKAGVELRKVPATPREIQNDLFKWTTTNRGSGIMVIGAPWQA